MKDGFNRTINYARISITDLCNMRCQYCMPVSGVDKKECGQILRLEEIAQVAATLTELGVNKIRLTGGEPLIRPGIVFLAEKIGALGLKDFAITTNGVLLPKYAQDLKSAGLNRVNISLDTLNAAKFTEITRGGHLADVLKGFEKAQEVGFEKIKINVVLIKGFNDNEVIDFVNLTKEYPIDVRFIELMSIGSQVDWTLNKYLSSDYVLEQVPQLVPVDSGDMASPAKTYQLPHALGKVGLISPISCKFCEHCNRIRITADGKLKHCLHSDEEVDIKPFIQNPSALKAVILDTVSKKPQAHHLDEGQYIKRNMVRIGG